MWRGWTRPEHADAYESYLKHELFPHVQAELGSRGYSGYHLLRRDGKEDSEFVSMLWFDSLDAVRGFAGDSYETPVISNKARTLLSRWAEQCEHLELRGKG
jgi:heme-degrading monooxygenase HmoA